MRKKIKIFGVGAAVLMLIMVISPAITASDPLPAPLAAALTNFPQTHSKDLEKINTFLSQWNGEDPIPFEIQAISDQLNFEMQSILAPYVPDTLSSGGVHQQYHGITARWITDDDYACIPDDPHTYWGYVRALNESFTDIFVFCIDVLDYGVYLAMLVLYWFLPPIIWWSILYLLSQTWDPFVDWVVEDVGPNQEYGIYFAFFKRDPWYHPTPLLNLLFYDFQPPHPWSPEDIWPIASWIQIT